VPKKFVWAPEDELTYARSTAHDHFDQFNELFSHCSVPLLEEKLRWYEAAFKKIGARMAVLLYGNVADSEKWNSRIRLINAVFGTLWIWIQNSNRSDSNVQSAIQAFAELHALKLGAEATLKANEEESEVKYFAE